MGCPLVALFDRHGHGVNGIGPIDHGMCKSIYFAGPDHMTLEVATSHEAIDPKAWIDPAVLAKAGIDAAEAARFKAPAAYAGPTPGAAAGLRRGQAAHGLSEGDLPEDAAGPRRGADGVGVAQRTAGEGGRGGGVTPHPLPVVMAGLVPATQKRWRAEGARGGRNCNPGWASVSGSPGQARG